MKKTILIAVALALFFHFRSHASQLAVDPTSGGTGVVSGNGGLTLGWEFQVTALQGISVDGLGFWDDGANGFFLSQTFPVGLWNVANSNLLRSTIITSASLLQPSALSSGEWRINPVAPLTLAPGNYRIGALFPTNGANEIVIDPLTLNTAPGISFVGFDREVGVGSLTMPNIGPPYPEAAWLGPTFTFTVVPEPACATLFLLGLGALQLRRWRR